MKRLLLLLVAQLLFCAGLSAQNDACRTVRDIAYREASGDGYIDSMCRLDLCYPTDRTGFPTVIWFHGGGLEGGRREIPAALCGQGFIASYGGDPHLIFVAGHSAGGYLSSMIGLDKRWLAPYGIDPDEAFAALIPYSGQVVTHFARRRELGLPDTQPLVDDLAPLNHVRADCPPVLILSGDRELELLGRYEENAYFWRMMRVVGHPDVRLREFDGFDHGNMPEAGHYVAVRYIREIVKKRSGR